MLHETEIRDLKTVIKKQTDEEQKKVREIESNKLKAQKEHRERLEYQQSINKLTASMNENHAKLKMIGQPSIVLKNQQLE